MTGFEAESCDIGSNHPDNSATTCALIFGSGCGNTHKTFYFSF